MNSVASDFLPDPARKPDPGINSWTREDVPPVPLPRRVPFSSLLALLRLTAAGLLRGRRLLILCLIFSLPVLLCILTRRFQQPYQAEETERVLIFGLIPQALLPLAALLFASGLVQDDVEEQTLTYLLIRPIPRWLIYLTKLTATWLVTSVVTIVFSIAALIVVHWGSQALSINDLIRRNLIFCGLLALSLLTYTAIFGALGLLVRRVLVLGVFYIVVFEGVVANIDFAVRHVTVMYYVRTLSIHWLNVSGSDWAIDPERAPGVAACLICLAGAAAFFALLGAIVFSLREFRVKTPEGS